MILSAPLNAIKTIPLEFNLLNFPCAVSPIIKGLRCLINTDLNTLQLPNNKFIKLSSKADQKYNLPKGFVFDGVLSNPPAVLWIYDIVKANLKFNERRELLKQNIKSTQYVGIIPSTIVDSERTILSIYEYFEKQPSYDGILIQFPNHFYNPDAYWMELTNLKLDKARVLTVNWKYDNFFGVTIDYNNLKIELTDGFNEEDKEYYSRYPEELHGNLIEVIITDVNKIRFYRKAT